MRYTEYRNWIQVMMASFLRMQKSMLIARFWDTHKGTSMLRFTSQGGCAQNNKEGCYVSEYSIEHRGIREIWAMEARISV